MTPHFLLKVTGGTRSMRWICSWDCVSVPMVILVPCANTRATCSEMHSLKLPHVFHSTSANHQLFARIILVDKDVQPLKFFVDLKDEDAPVNNKLGQVYHLLRPAEVRKVWLIYRMPIVQGHSMTSLFVHRTVLQVLQMKSRESYNCFLKPLIIFLMVCRHLQ